MLKIFVASGSNFMKSLHECCDAGVIISVQLLEGPLPTKFGRAKTSKIWHDFLQLSTVIVNIITTTHQTFDIKKDGDLWSTNKKVIGAHIDVPKTNCARYFGHLRISPEAIEILKIWKAVGQIQHLPCWAKIFCKLCSTNQKVISAHINPK